MSAHELPLLRNHKRLLAAAIRQERVRIRGTVAEKGPGYSGKYRNTWLRVETAGANVRVTATPSSPLGRMPMGSTVELAASLTGIVDLTSEVFMAERAQLLASTPPGLKHSTQ